MLCIYASSPPPTVFWDAVEVEEERIKEAVCRNSARKGSINQDRTKLISEKKASERTWARQGRKMEWAVSSIAMFVFVLEGERVRFDVSCCWEGESVSFRSKVRGDEKEKRKKGRPRGRSGEKDNVHRQVNPTFPGNQAQR